MILLCGCPIKTAAFFMCMHLENEIVQPNLENSFIKEFLFGNETKPAMV